MPRLFPALVLLLLAGCGKPGPAEPGAVGESESRALGEAAVMLHTRRPPAKQEATPEPTPSPSA